MENYINKAVVIIPHICPEQAKAIRQFLKHIFLGPPTNEIELCCFLAIYTLITIYIITEIIKTIIWFIKLLKEMFKRKESEDK